MRIEAVNQPLSAELRKVENAKKNDKNSKSSSTLSSADSSEFSSNAQRLSESNAQFQTISASIQAQPDVRADKVAEVKNKIQTGFYNTPEFLNQLTDKMLSEFGIKNPG